jgi:hypothetical protein
MALIPVKNLNTKQMKMFDEFDKGHRSVTVPRRTSILSGRGITYNGLALVLDSLKPDLDDDTKKDIERIKITAENLDTDGETKLIAVTHFDTLNRKFEIIFLAALKSGTGKYNFALYSDKFSQIGSTYQNCGTTVPDNEIDDHIFAYAAYMMQDDGAMKLDGNSLKLTV